jgi:hypothetical protein
MYTESDEQDEEEKEEKHLHSSNNVIPDFLQEDFYFDKSKYVYSGIS